MFLKIYSNYKKEIRALLFLLGLLFFFFLVKDSWYEIEALLGSINQSVAALSIIVAMFGNVAAAIFFHRLLGKYGVKLTELLTLKIYLIGQIAKYIPGKIWAMAYQISHVTGASGAAGVMLANTELMIGVMLITSTLSIALLSFLVSKILALVLVFLGALVFVFFYKTNAINSALQFVTKKFEFMKFLADRECEVTLASEGIVFYLVFSLFYLVSFALMLYAVFGFTLEESIVYIAMLSIAWIGGVLIFIVPVGIGVRELIFVIASGYMVPQQSVEMLASIAIVCRFWQMIQEIAGASILLFLPKD